MVQRRCSQRQLLLLPTETVKAVFLYSLAYAAAKTGVQVHGFCCLANHFHLVLTDPQAQLPVFMQILDGLVARALNAYHDRHENFWAPGSYTAVRLVDGEDVVRKLVYTLCNPVAAGLVAFGSEWPGLRTAPDEVGRARYEAVRPMFFFRDTMPEKITLELTPPAVCVVEHGKHGEEFSRELARRCFDEERGIRNRFQAERKTFMGAEAVLKQCPTDTPRSHRPFRKLKPRVACIDKWRRIEVLQRLMEFLARYHEAFRRFARGERDVEFPAGTYWMRVHLAVRCDAPP